MISLCNLTSKLKNGIRANKKYIYLPSSSLSLELLRLLFLEGIILGVTKIKSGKILKVFLKYISWFFQNPPSRNRHLQGWR